MKPVSCKAHLNHTSLSDNKFVFYEETEFLYEFVEKKKIPKEFKRIKYNLF